MSARQARHCGRSKVEREEGTKLNCSSFSRRASATLVASVAALAVFAGGVARDARAATCPPPPTPVQPFVPWSDTGDYVLTTGGSFEKGAAAWTLTGGAQLVSDNAPNALDPSTDSRSLYLPAGSSATSPCVTAPHILGVVRFFAKSLGDASAQLRVDVLVKGSDYDAGTISAGSSWAPAPILRSPAPYYSGAVAYQVRLTPVGANAAFRVDDVYFDPHAYP
jgi:hypothetical protein